MLESWMRSYRPEELFDAGGRQMDWLAAHAPAGNRRMSANPHANGGLLLDDLELADFREFGVTVDEPGATTAAATRQLGTWLADVVRRNPNTFRVMGPDEVASNRLSALRGDRPGVGGRERLPTDDHPAPGRPGEVLSEHPAKAGSRLPAHRAPRLHHGYEAFIHTSTRCSTSTPSGCARAAGRRGGVRRLAQLPAVDFTSSARPQRLLPPDPGSPTTSEQKAEVIRLPPARRQHASSVADHRLRSRDYVNTIGRKQPRRSGSRWKRPCCTG